MLFQAACGNTLGTLYIADQTDLSFGQSFQKRNLYNFSHGNMLCSQSLREKANAQVVLDQGEYLICGGNLHIR